MVCHVPCAKLTKTSGKSHSKKCQQKNAKKKQLAKFGKICYDGLEWDSPARLSHEHRGDTLKYPPVYRIIPDAAGVIKCVASQKMGGFF